MINILLTRALCDNIEIKQRYGSSNYNFISCPLFEYQNLKIDLSLLAHYSDIIITSSYAASLLEYNKYSLKAWVVGEKSASILKVKNYDIAFIAKDASELLLSMPRHIFTKMLYLSGNIITRQLPKEIKRIIIYKTHYLQSLSDEYIEFFNREKIDYIFLYSRIAVDVLINLLRKKNALDLLNEAIVIAISRNVASNCNYNFKRVHYVKNNNSEAMIKLLIEYSNGITKNR